MRTLNVRRRPPASRERSSFVLVSSCMLASSGIAAAQEPDGTTRDTTTFAIGPRLHFKLSDKTWFRPGVSLTLPIDDPMKKAEYKIVQLDLPFTF